ncbi:MAG: hypothetical protein ABEJ82_03760 [Haloplanus sp.]
MLVRLLLVVVGLLELALPRRTVDFWMNLAADGDVELRPWVYKAARVEGALLVLWALRPRRRRASEEAS